MGWRHARSEEHTSELQSPSVISYAVFCLKKKNKSRAWLRRGGCWCGSIRRRMRLYARPVWWLSSDQSLCSVHRHPLLFFFNDTATTEIYTTEDTLSLHDALPISTGPTSPRTAASTSRVTSPTG